MKKTLGKLLFSKVSLSVFTVLSAFGLLLSYSVRYGYVFVDAVIFENSSFAFFIVSVFTTAFLFAMLCLKINNKSCADNKIMKLITFVSELFGVLLIVYSFVTVITDRGMSISSLEALLKKAFPIWCAAAFGAFFIFIFPKLKNVKVKKAVSIISVAALMLVTYASLFPISPYSFTSGPVVFDDGNGSYSIVFSTNDNGTGYVDYTYKGKEIRVFDNNNGRKNGQSIIHTVKVPKEELSGNAYKVGSTRVIDELSYGGRLGKTLESQPYKFNDNFDENINVLSVSDWHTFNEKALTAVKKFGDDYQAVVLLGDCAPGLMSEQDVVDYILKFSYDLTGGTMPIIYTRGNHETRGREAVNLSKRLGIDSFYFTTSIGDYDVIVLDSCEDKEDSHPEYGGMVDYKQYRTKMVDWLDSLNNKDNNKTIVFSHSNEICIEEDLAENALNKINSLNASLLVSGHFHSYSFDNTGSVPLLVDGGVDANGSGTYVASLIKLSPDGIDIICMDNNANNVINESTDWKN